MIYIVRHGQTDWNIVARYQGRKDVELNETGIKQAKTLKEELSNVKFDKIISSPLKRALQTAEIISNLDNLNDILIDERIMERGLGKLEGKLETNLDSNINFNDQNETKYGIEPIIDFRNRIFDFCKDLERDYKNKNVLVVTHGGAGIYIRCYFEGEPEEKNYKKYKLKNSELIKYSNEENI